MQAGFFDVREEDAMTREIGKEFRPATVDEIEGKRHRVRSAWQNLALCITLHGTLLPCNDAASVSRGPYNFSTDDIFAACGLS